MAQDREHAANLLWLAVKRLNHPASVPAVASPRRYGLDSTLGRGAAKLRYQLRQGRIVDIPAGTTRSESLSDWFVSVDTDPVFTEAVVTLRDNSRLCFCHRVGERWAKAFGPDDDRLGFAHILLDAIQLFRLNAKHLEIFFDDESCWEWQPPVRPTG